jgi:hypothetical protein
MKAKMLHFKSAFTSFLLLEYNERFCSMKTKSNYLVSMKFIIPQARDEKIQDGMWLNRKDFWAIVMFHMHVFRAVPPFTKPKRKKFGVAKTCALKMTELCVSSFIHRPKRWWSFTVACIRLQHVHDKL